MLLRHVSIEKLGPFHETLTLPLDDRVTIITGSNDVGKSRFLHAIELLINGGVIDDSMVNHDHVQNGPKPWLEDRSISVEGMFTVDKISEFTKSPKRISPGDKVWVRRILPKSVASTVTRTNLTGRGTEENQHELIMPRLVKVSAGSAMRDEIDLRNPLPLEKAVLHTGFEGNFDFRRFEAMNDLQFGRAVRHAQTTLNRLLERVMPKPGMVQFDFLPSVGGNRQILGVLIRDRHDGITPLGTRGDGVRRMITLLAELVTGEQTAHHRIILLDEPENSLHADAQHLLREFLFALTADHKTQVVYATHSPCMIHPMRQEQIRLLTRGPVNNTPTVRLESKPTQANFLGLRTSLGISAADSLLFAPVTIVMEGDTEVRCLLPLIEKIYSGNPDDLANATRLLGLSHFLDGNGDSYEFLCRLAKSHGTRVVLFLDGDKRQRVVQQRVEETHPDIPIIFLPGTSEIEELVPKLTYLRALIELTEIEGNIEDHEAALSNWTTGNERRTRFAFSKKIEGWFSESFDVPFPSKPEIMLRAINIASPEELVTEPIANLLAAIDQQLVGTSFQ